MHCASVISSLRGRRTIEVIHRNAREWTACFQQIGNRGGYIQKRYRNVGNRQSTACAGRFNQHQWQRVTPHPVQRLCTGGGVAFGIAHAESYAATVIAVNDYQGAVIQVQVFQFLDESEHAAQGTRRLRGKSIHAVFKFCACETAIRPGDQRRVWCDKVDELVFGLLGPCTHAGRQILQKLVMGKMLELHFRPGGQAAG